MKSLSFFGFFAVLLSLYLFVYSDRAEAAAQTSGAAGNLVTEAREVPPFTRVRLEILGELTLTQGDARVALEFSPKYEGLITTEVRDGTLIIGSNRRLTQRGRDVLRYTVTLPQLEGVELKGSGGVTMGGFDAETLAIGLDGSGDVTAEDLQAARLELSLAGSGDVKVERLDASQIGLSLSGSGSISTTGRADTLAVEVAGSGNVDAGGLRANQVNVSLAGSGDVSVCAAEGLEVSSSGSGDVTYYGEPGSSSVSVSGSSDVRAGGACQ